MRVSSRTWANYQRAHAEVQTRAAEDAMAYFDSLPWDTDPDLARSLMRARVAELVDAYGIADGEVSAIWYDELMAMQGATVPAAEVAQGMPARMVAADVDDAIGRALTRDTTRQAVGDVTARHVKRCGLETTRANAVRDRAMWAWVCIGDSCPFCRTLGSQGWVHASKAVRAGQHAEHVHANCDCQFVVKPAGAVLEVEGYDPDALLDEYTDAQKRAIAESGGTSRLGNQTINQMRRDGYTPEFAEQRNARRRELYAQRRAEQANQDD